jgi:hypothetical protein
MNSKQAEHVVGVLRRVVPLVERSATAEARANMAPTGQRKRDEQKRLLADVKDAITWLEQNDGAIADMLGLSPDLLQTVASDWALSAKPDDERGVHVFVRRYAKALSELHK